MLLEPPRHKDVKGFGAIIFRRTSVQITQEGGLWDTAGSIYPLLGARPRMGQFLDYRFPKSGVRVRFAHLQHEKDKYNHDGAQYAFVGFDELQHFTKTMFIYIISRNRSTCGIRPYVRATCNPDPNSFLRELLDWWINKETGLPIPERGGRVRWFVVHNDEFLFADTWVELRKRFGCEHVHRYLDFDKHRDLPRCPECGTELKMPLSLTFIPSKLTDNPALLQKDPQYLAKLQMQTRAERERLLEGNWNIVAGAGMYFKREEFRPVTELRGRRFLRMMRYWDRAATEPSEENPDPSWTAGPLLALGDDRMWYLLDVQRFRKRPGPRNTKIIEICKADQERWGWQTKKYYVGLEVDPGQAGVEEAENLSKELAAHGFVTKLNRVRESKGKRAEVVSAQCEQGNVCYLPGPWSNDFFNEAENFDGTDKGHADQVDGFSGGYSLLNRIQTSLTWGSRN